MTKEPEIQFDWDEHNESHIRRHRVSPQEFEEAMRNRHVLARVDCMKGERRFLVIGATNGLRVLVLVYAQRGRRIRPVTARDADRKGREEYFASVGTTDE